MSCPQVVDGVFPEAAFEALQQELDREVATGASYDPGFGRYCLVDGPLLTARANDLVPLARRVFRSDTILPSYSFFASYQGESASLFRHRDINACTYTIDMCVQQRVPWPLWVEGTAYTLHANQALAFYGNDQEHWREAFVAPAVNRVDMIFFHFVEPEHWWYVRGPSFHRTGILPLQRALDATADPNHRQVLQALIASRGTADFYHRIRDRFPCADPLDTVFACVDAICDPGGPLGLSFNKTVRRAARCLAERRPIDEILGELNASRRIPFTRADVERVAADLRETPLGMLFP